MPEDLPTRHAFVLSATASLRSPGGPRILHGRVAEGFLAPVARRSPATAARSLADLESMGVLERIRPGLYVNRAAPSPVADEEILHLLRPGAVVSLHTVLGRAGVLSGAPTEVTAIVPVRPGESPGLGRTAFGPRYRARLFGMPPDLLDGPALEGLCPMDEGVPHPSASPEKALADWTWLAARPRSGLGMPPLDADLDLLDPSLALDMARTMGVGDRLEAWLDRKREHDADPAVVGNGVPGAGF